MKDIHKDTHDVNEPLNPQLRDAVQSAPMLRPVPRGGLHRLLHDVQEWWAYRRVRRAVARLMSLNQ